MTDATSIPLNKLTAWDGNVRKTAGADTALAELAASIAAHGLLQSLVVRKDKKGKFSVVAGGRRLQALQQLAESGSIEADSAVPCQVIASDADATEISLTENVMRAPMHPADQFDAFRELVDNGSTPADIAARFGVGSHRISKVVDEWATRAIALGYIQVIDPERFEAWIGSEAKAEAGRLGAEERGTPSLEVSRSRLRRVSESVMSGSDRGRRSYGFLQPANAALIAALARAIRGCEGRGSQFFGQAAALLRDLRTAVEGSDGPRPTPPASWASDFNRPSPAPPVPAEEVLYAFNS